MVSFFLDGAISNDILSKILKKLLNQDRPTPTDTATNTIIMEQPSDKGMPSSHAMSLGFIGTFTALTLPWTRLSILLYVEISLYYRIHTKLHTKEQVGVGLIVGVVNGVLWRTLVDGSKPLFPSINVMDFVSRHLLDEMAYRQSHFLLFLPW
jgi:membrane-associated phospholipid phosphatase